MRTKIEHYFNGVIKKAYAVNPIDIPHGLYEELHENGKLKIRCTYADGKLDGLHEEYYETDVY